MNYTRLIPVSQWVYDLYKVSYWTREGGRLIGTVHITSHGNHIDSDANEHAPHDCEWISWEVVQKNVGHPRVIGNRYGHDIHESGFVHGQRLASKIKY